MHYEFLLLGNDVTSASDEVPTEVKSRPRVERVGTRTPGPVPTPEWEWMAFESPGELGQWIAWNEALDAYCFGSGADWPGSQGTPPDTRHRGPTRQSSKVALCRRSSDANHLLVAEQTL